MSAPLGSRLLRAAALIASITVLARVAGFARTIVFGRTVGSGCVGSVYQTANTVPNIVFDLVAGGVLSALVVPILAPYFAAGDREAASRTVSALLGWAMLVLVPAALLVAVLARSLVHGLLGGDQCAGAVALGTRMLLVFAPQVVFYGLAVIISGALQAAERFAWPALAPLVSSLVVIVGYLWYGALAGAGRDASGLPRVDELVLSVGTTAGVVVLACCQLPALSRAGVRIRPTLRLPAGLAPAARQAALAGTLVLGAQQLSSAVMIRLANDGTSTGTVVVTTLAQTVFLLPWAVLAIPVAISVFPQLAAAWDAGERAVVRALTARSTAAVAGLSAVGTAALVAAAEPVGNVLLAHNAPSHEALAPTIAAFAVGLIGWSLVALFSRCLYAARAPMPAAWAQVAGQLVVVGVDVLLAVLVAARWRAVSLALGNAVGVWLAVIMLAVVARRAGLLATLRTPALDLGRAALAAMAGAATGWLVGRHAEGRDTTVSVVFGLAAVVVAALVTGLALIGTDGALRTQLRARLGPTG